MNPLESMNLTMSAPSLAAISQLSQLIGKSGLAAEIQSSNPVATGIEAHLQIRNQGAQVKR